MIVLIGLLIKIKSGVSDTTSESKVSFAINTLLFTQKYQINRNRQLFTTLYLIYFSQKT